MREFILIARKVEDIAKTIVGSNVMADKGKDFCLFELNCLVGYIHAAAEIHESRQKDVAELSRILRHFISVGDDEHVKRSDMIKFLDELDGV
jgi:predicted hydrolase (HD superfamily)